MKKVYLLAAMAALLTACSQTEELSSVDQNKTDEPSAINFDVYTARNTRAGKQGEITTATLQTGDHSAAGFGIFAYYTDNGKYDQYCKPNFMYNQQVTYNGSKWTYEPVKYWPNETGNAAKSDDVDYVSFFAYAPWVKVVPSSGAIDITGITGDAAISQAQNYNITEMTTNVGTGDPLIKYVVDWAPKSSVDLLWGVDGTTGLPFTNQVKQATGEKVSFTLKHALCKLNMQIDAYVDATSLGTAVDTKTKIWVRAIIFEGYATKGALNLNNTTANTPLWMDYAGINALGTEAFTIYDGRKDGREGFAGDDGAANNEKVLGLNPEIIQPGVYTINAGGDLTATKNGVTATTVNLFDPGTEGNVSSPIFVIPTGEKMIVTIIYDVETYDPNLAGYLSDGATHGSTIENKITQTIKSGATDLTMEAGKSYTVKLHLGMTSVKTEAEVTGWDVSSAPDVDLPKNN